MKMTVVGRQLSNLLRMQTNLVKLAISGDRKALEELISSVKDKIYNLSIRYLWHPQNAEDATQEILIKIITNLSTFKGESLFSTWCFRIAVNYLLNLKRNKTEQNITFSEFSNQLKEGLDRPSYSGADSGILEEEVKTGCTLGMLLCLSPEFRIAFILNTVFNLNSKEASQIMDIKPETFRKRLSRAKESVEHFMQANCGLINKSKPCRCGKRIPHAIETNRIDPQNLLFAGKIKDYNAQMEELHDVAGIYKSHPDFKTPAYLLKNIYTLLTSNRYTILKD
jgi:RNA polymerase sigma factor (sigma-70 family)